MKDDLNPCVARADEIHFQRLAGPLAQGLPLSTWVTEPGAPGSHLPILGNSSAQVGAVYTIDRFARTVDDEVDELRRQRAPALPARCHKHVLAEMTTVFKGELYNGRVTLFDRLAQERSRRQPAWPSRR